MIAGFFNVLLIALDMARERQSSACLFSSFNQRDDRIYATLLL
jgi:hypothetical protein